MKAQKYSKEGKLISEIELPSALFESKLSVASIYEAIKAENANLRSGNHATKTRSEVRGGGKKPWAQKEQVVQDKVLHALLIGLAGERFTVLKKRLLL